MCPHANRSQVHKEFLMMLAQKAGMDFDQEYIGVNNVDYDKNSAIGLDMAS